MIYRNKLIEIRTDYPMIAFYLFGKQIEFWYSRLPRETIGFYKTVKHYQRHIVSLNFYLGVISKHYSPCGRGSAITITVLKV
jgi:hypothetical protein